MLFFFSSRRRHTRFDCDWSSDVCSSDLGGRARSGLAAGINETMGYGAVALTAFAATEIAHAAGLRPRSEERRVGKESRAQWSALLSKKEELARGESAQVN